MIRLDDETLLAYVDGELDSQRALQVRKLLENDQEARERVRIFRQSAMVLHGVFDAPLHEPVPDRLLSAASGQQPADLKARRQHRNDGIARRTVWAVAAMVLLLVGFAGGRFFFISNQSAVSADPVLEQALEALASGETLYWPDPADAAQEITPLMTFKKQNGHFCREFERRITEHDQVYESVGIACRNDFGSWHPVLWMARELAIPALAGGSPRDTHLPDEPDNDNSAVFIPAAGDDMTPYDKAVAALMASPPLSAEQESILIENAWR